MCGFVRNRTYFSTITASLCQPMRGFLIATEETSLPPVTLPCPFTVNENVEAGKRENLFFFLSNHRVISMEAATALQSSTPRRYFTVPIILQAWTNHDRRDKRTSLFLKSEQSFIFTSEYPNPNFHKVHLAKENEQWMAFIRKNTENIFKSRCQRRFSG